MVSTCWAHRFFKYSSRVILTCANLVASPSTHRASCWRAYISSLLLVLIARHVDVRSTYISSLLQVLIVRHVDVRTSRRFYKCSSVHDVGVRTSRRFYKCSSARHVDIRTSHRFYKFSSRVMLTCVHLVASTSAHRTSCWRAYISLLLQVLISAWCWRAYISSLLQMLIGASCWRAYISSLLQVLVGVSCWRAYIS